VCVYNKAAAVVEMKKKNKNVVSSFGCVSSDVRSLRLASTSVVRVRVRVCPFISFFGFRMSDSYVQTV
jgi:hypothetical protein